jgi:ubiquinone biosynthesis protein
MTLSASRRAQDAGVLRSIPRRERVATEGSPGVSLRAHEVTLPQPSVLRVMGRAARWGWACVRTMLRLALDRVSGRGAIEHKAVRYRELFEMMGGTAIKVGQQLSVRVDFLPFEVCQELGLLFDSVPAFPVHHAIARIESLTGVPLHETFAELEPEPIGAASVACVWRGTLHTGERVAVKVRRPKVAQHFVADLTLLSWLTRSAEILTLVRPDYFKYLRRELRSMFLDELDFHKEATYQNMFRRYLKRDRIRWVSAPRVYASLSSVDVLTTEFIDAYSCTDILIAVETNDEPALELLRQQGIDPAELGTNIMQLSLWSRLECPFFHSDPHPGNILIAPGGHIVMLDFGACGIMSRKHAEQQMEMMRRLTANDMSGGSAVSLSLLAPMPNIDIAAVRESMEAHMWDFQIRVLSKDADWWERTSAMIWLGMVEATQKYKIPVNLSVLRITRASLLYDTLACRLNPDTNFSDAFRTWQKKSSRRAERRAKRRLDRLKPSDTRAAALQQAVELTETLRKGSFWLSYLSREVPREFNYINNVGSYTAAAVLRFTLLGSLAGVLLLGAVVLGAQLVGQRLAIVDTAWMALTHPVTVLLIVFLVLARLNRLRQRLREKKVS